MPKPEFTSATFFKAVSTSYLMSNESVVLSDFIEKRKIYSDDPRCTELFKDYFKVEVSEVLGLTLETDVLKIEKLDDNLKRFCLESLDRSDTLANNFLFPEEANGPDLQSRHDLLREILSR